MQTKLKFLSSLKLYGIEKLVHKMNNKQKYSNKVININLNYIDDNLISKGHLKQDVFKIENIDIRKVIGTLHPKYNSSHDSWYFLFNMHDILDIPYSKDYIKQIALNPNYIHNEKILFFDNDNIEYVTYDNGKTFYIQNGNRRAIIAKHYFSIEEYFCDFSDYTVNNVITYYK
jgi:hypothetical protein